MRSVALVAAGALAVAAGCSAAGEEPAGLTTEPAAGSPSGGSTTPPPAEPSDDAGETPPAETGEPGEPDPSFTQPYLPEDAQSVIELPTDLPVEPTEGASEQEQEVVAALGRFMASWNALLFGASLEQAGAEETSSGEQLDRFREYVADAEEREWVFVGQPMQLTVRAIAVDEPTATTDVCIDLPQWFEWVNGELQMPQVPSPERYVVTFQSGDGGWIVSDTDEQDPADC